MSGLGPAGLEAVARQLDRFGSLDDMYNLAGCSKAASAAVLSIRRSLGGFAADPASVLQFEKSVYRAGGCPLDCYIEMGSNWQSYVAALKRCCPRISKRGPDDFFLLVDLAFDRGNGEMIQRVQGDLGFLYTMQIMPVAIREQEISHLMYDGFGQLTRTQVYPYLALLLRRDPDIVAVVMLYTTRRAFLGEPAPRISRYLESLVLDKPQPFQDAYDAGCRELPLILHVWLCAIGARGLVSGLSMLEEFQHAQRGIDVAQIDITLQNLAWTWFDYPSSTCRMASASYQTLRSRVTGFWS